MSIELALPVGEWSQCDKKDESFMWMSRGPLVTHIHQPIYQSTLHSKWISFNFHLGNVHSKLTMPQIPQTLFLVHKLKWRWNPFSFGEKKEWKLYVGMERRLLWKHQDDRH